MLYHCQTMKSFSTGGCVLLYLDTMMSKVEQGTHQADHGHLEFGSLFDKGVIALERGVPRCLFARGRLTYFFERARERGIGVIWIWV